MPPPKDMPPVLMSASSPPAAPDKAAPTAPQRDSLTLIGTPKASLPPGLMLSLVWPSSPWKRMSSSVAAMLRAARRSVSCWRASSISPSNCPRPTPIFCRSDSLLTVTRSTALSAIWRPSDFMLRRKTSRFFSRHARRRRLKSSRRHSWRTWKMTSMSASSWTQQRAKASRLSTAFTMLNFSRWKRHSASSMSSSIAGRGGPV